MKNNYDNIIIQLFFKGEKMKMFLTMLLFVLFVPTIQAKEIVLTQDNSVVLNGEVTGRSVSKLIGEIKKLDAELKNGYPIYLFLNTPGGSIQAGLELFEFVKGVNRPVHTITLFAASMGFQTVQHFGTRYILEYGVLMSHKAYGGFEGEFGGESSQLDSQYGLWLRRIKMMDQKTVERTKGKKTLKKYQAEYDNELWLNGAEAVKNGYADEVVSVKCSTGLQGEKEEQVNFMGMRFTVKFDKCPIRTAPVSVTASVRTNKGLMTLDDFIAKGGNFDTENCQRNAQVQSYGWSNQAMPAIEAEICALDKGLSVDKVEQIIQEYKNKNLTKNKKVIKMSFGSFVSE
jgi:ATP-dependent Clp protease protease subunit